MEPALSEVDGAPQQDGRAKNFAVLDEDVRDVTVFISQFMESKCLVREYARLS